MVQPTWITPAGTIGTFPSTLTFNTQLVAAATTALTYAIISGSLPVGVTMDSHGLISGTPGIVTALTKYPFVVRATDAQGNLRDRSFSVSISGTAAPAFTTPAGPIPNPAPWTPALPYSFLDSTWIEIPVTYSNPLSSNAVTVALLSGSLPDGLEINAAGLIRGYAQPPTIQRSTQSVTTVATSTNGNTNSISCYSTVGFVIGRPVNFTGSTFGGIASNQTYYINNIVNNTTFTISGSVGGQTIPLTSAIGTMTATMPAISAGAPITQTFSFTLKLLSVLGSATQTYTMTITNQNLPISEGGPGLPPDTRVPAIYNTRPETYALGQHLTEFGYYVLPKNPAIPGETYAPSDFAYIGEFQSSDFFAFSILGHDFDGAALQYTFIDLPLGLMGDSATGWITGIPILSVNTINQYSFSVSVAKNTNNTITSAVFRFSFNITNNINGTIVWSTPTNLGQINNAVVSTLQVRAICDVSLQYRLAAGSLPLPPNLMLQADGEITGIVAFQPTGNKLAQGDSTVFTFTVEAYSPQFSVVSATQEFTLTVYQEFEQPFDTLYIQCTPDQSDRNTINTLLTSNFLIPEQYLYRPTDPNFGKAQSVIYEHAYGIDASNLEEYLSAVKINHYWRNITLGQIDIAQAISETTGKVVYEVVYSKVIDNLVNYNTVQFSNIKQTNKQNPNGISVAKDITWPRPIPLPTAGYALNVYPNSLINMRQQVVNVLGQQSNYQLLPAWMTTQQSDGSTLGYTQAWVIAYCLPETEVLPVLEVASCDEYAFTLASGDTTGLTAGNRISFVGNMFGGLVSGKTYYVQSVPSSSAFTISDTLFGPAKQLVPNDPTQSGPMTASVTIVLPNGTVTGTPTYAQYIQYQITNSWLTPAGELNTLNTINFEIDRFTVNKSLTYNYDNNIIPNIWTMLPSATPTPAPMNSKDFYVLFPQQTILPIEPQVPHFTVTSTDFNLQSASSDRVSIINGPGVTPVAGFTVIDEPGNTITNAWYALANIPLTSGSAELRKQIISAFQSTGMAVDGTAYMWNVTWANTSSFPNQLPYIRPTGIVRLAYNAAMGQLYMSPVDTSYTGTGNWTISNPVPMNSQNPALAGTFRFPATFTPYTPVTISNGNYW
jgi:hypothetical protein